MPSVPTAPQTLRWALRRSGLDVETLRPKFKRIDSWLDGTGDPSLTQLRDFAKRTRTPLGLLMLPEPPSDEPGIADYRTAGDRQIDQPSPDLLETIQDVRQRQAFMRDYRIEEGFEPLAFVGSIDVGSDVAGAAVRVRSDLSLAPDWNQRNGDAAAAYRSLKATLERAGVLVFQNGVAGRGTNRPLDPNEFRGFVLVDDVAPTIFVNVADGVNAKMFTLVHETVHVWVGREGIVGGQVTGGEENRNNDPDRLRIELYCNEVAGELLMPEVLTRDLWRSMSGRERTDFFNEGSRRFRCSPLAVARRAASLGLINDEAFFTFYRQQRETFAARRKLRDEKPDKQSGGDFYTTTGSRLSPALTDAVSRLTAEGRMTYTEAYRLVGARGRAFDELMRRRAGRR